MIEGHYSTRYDVELTELGLRTLEMGQLVEKQLKNAATALAQGDLMLAKLVSETENQVNQLEVEIDGQCTELLARRQPIAGDLRFVLMIIKSVNDFERMGDEISRVALLGTRASRTQDNAPVFEYVETVTARVIKLLKQTLKAFEETDDVAALSLIRTDQKVDKKLRNTLKQTIKWMMREPDSIPDAVDVLWSLRSLERVADRACNVCEHIIYFRKGADLRHLDIDEIDLDD